MKYGLIAGEGRFPLLVLQSAKQQGHKMVVVAVREEASPEIEQWTDRCYWISLGEFSKLIKIFHEERISEVLMAGRVRHSRIYSSIRPDWRLLKLLTTLPRKNTNSLIGAVTRVLADEGIQLLDSTSFLQPFMVREGLIANRPPTPEEAADIEYGRDVAAGLAGFDVGQTVVICEKACVAVEAMEGTNAVILRAGELSNGRRLTVVKAARPKQDLRFDVPVAGPTTIEKMRLAGATVLALEADQTLLIDRDQMISAANDANIAAVGYVRSKP